jgi:hypothetical protein
MANHAVDYVNLTRICEFARRLHQLHRLGGEDAIDREFGAGRYGASPSMTSLMTTCRRRTMPGSTSSPRSAQSSSRPSRATTSGTTSTAVALPTGGASHG